MFNVLTEPLIRLRTSSGERTACSLPQVFALLAADAVTEFPALRPHQRHPWHAFLVQLGAMALHRAGRSDVPADEGEWAALIRGLTPEWPDDEPWSLVAPPKCPGLLQPPTTPSDPAYSKQILTPDGLDMLVNSRNHDFKTEVMGAALPDDWVFALISGQTANGGLSGSYRGIARAKSDYNGRNAVSVMPSGRHGTHFCRDLQQVLKRRHELLTWVPDFDLLSGLGLLWLRPWNGSSPVYSVHELDPLFLEICRKVRLFDKENHGICCLLWVSKRLIHKGFSEGITGDPWSPVNSKEMVVSSAPKNGYSYKYICDILFDSNTRKPLLLDVSNDDADNGLSVVARGVVRKQGGTAGYHERLVPISKEVVRFFRTSTDPLAEMAKGRVSNAGTLRGQVLRPALFALLQNGPDSIDGGDGSASAQAGPWLDRFERRVDEAFFPDLWREAAAESDDERNAVRREWLRALAAVALDLLGQASRSVPQAAMRRYRAKVRARQMFFFLLRKHFPDLNHEDADDRTARPDA